MNARHLHALYRQNWPRFSAVECEWENLLPEPEPSPLRIEQFIRRFVQTPTVLVHVSRAVGGEFEPLEAARLICTHIGSRQIEIAARDLSALVVIGQPGVGTGIIYPKPQLA